jgi:hypothetical protein
VTVLQIEHAISDFEVWKDAFDSDPLRREQSGVRSYRVYRPLDDARYVKIDLEFDTPGEAEAFHAKLQGLWGSGRAAPALVGNPQARLVEVVQAEEF